MNTKVIIDSASNILYKSFYVYALTERFGVSHVSFSSEPFKDLAHTTREHGGMVFIIRENTKTIRYVISVDDSYCVNDELYQWCDVYGSVNANFALTPKKYHAKLVSLCPSFGIRCWSLPQTIYYGIHNYLDFHPSRPKNFLGRHKAMYQRTPYSDYLTKIDVEDNYVFFASTLWYSDEWNHNDAGVNLRRANFIRACKQIPNILFEGGLVSQGSDRSSENLFLDCLWGGVNMNKWLENTRKSILVFNTPAFWDCHGWKLGEYLAMGKCIVSTALSNDLPAPLIHGKHIHLVDNTEESMREAVAYIIKHPEYRKQLEQHVRAYWEQYGSPAASLRLLGI